MNQLAQYFGELDDSVTLFFLFPYSQFSLDVS